jgi:hypothetical protein
MRFIFTRLPDYDKLLEEISQKLATPIAKIYSLDGKRVTTYRDQQ